MFNTLTLAKGKVPIFVEHFLNCNGNNPKEQIPFKLSFSKIQVTALTKIDHLIYMSKITEQITKSYIQMVKKKCCLCLLLSTKIKNRLPDMMTIYTAECIAVKRLTKYL